MRSVNVVASLTVVTMAAGSAGAVVIRHDVSDCAYLAPAAAFPALVELPWDGQGVLIAPRWVLTVAHVTELPISEVTVDGKPRRVAQVIVHPGNRVPPKTLTGAPLTKAKIENDDIALLELAEPVTDVAPMPLYRGTVEVGQRVELVGRGATGNGQTGQAPDSPHRGVLRRAFSRVTSAKGRWLTSRFDAPPATEPLAGSAGDGDSGGPILIETSRGWRLAALTSWRYVEGSPTDFRPGFYGQISYNVLVSHYVRWIDGVLARPKSVAASQSSQQRSPAAQIIAAWDSAHNGSISRAEWIAAGQMPEQAFVRVDANRDGEVDEAELTVAINALRARQAQEQKAAALSVAQCQTVDARERS